MSGFPGVGVLPGNSPAATFDATSEPIASINVEMYILFTVCL
jgi:hypothetical protein